MQALSKYNLPAPSNLLRLMIQQSGCFQVVERGLGMQNMMQERQMQQGGQLQSNSNVGGGQMVSADFIMTPEVNFKESNTGGAGMLGGMGALFGPIGMIAGAVASNLKFTSPHQIVSFVFASSTTNLSLGDRPVNSPVSTANAPVSGTNPYGLDTLAQQAIVNTGNAFLRKMLGLKKGGSVRSIKLPSHITDRFKNKVRH